MLYHRDVVAKDINSKIATIKQNKKRRFVGRCPTGFEIGINKPLAYVPDDDVLMLASNKPKKVLHCSVINLIYNVCEESVGSIRIQTTAQHILTKSMHFFSFQEKNVIFKIGQSFHNKL